jgi:hypothetical protein
MPETIILNMEKDTLPNHYIYIGRSRSENNLGNPFTTHEPKHGQVKVKDRDQAILMFDQWLEGKIYPDLAPVRREYILKACILLIGRTMVCHCKPLPCHGDVLVKHGLLAKQRETDYLNNLAVTLASNV